MNKSQAPRVALNATETGGMNSIYPKPLLRRGVFLGLKASIIASLLFWGVTVIMSLFYEGDGTSNEQAGFFGVLLILIIATLVVSFIPGTIGGSANAYVLYQLASRKKLTKATSITSGLLIGFLAGFAIIFGIVWISGDGVDTEILQFALLIACIASPVGGWHGWEIGRWLKEVQG